MPRTRYAFRITLTPICQICDDRYCSCGQHSTYSFQRIIARDYREAVDLAYELVDATRETHTCEFSSSTAWPDDVCV